MKATGIVRRVDDLGRIVLPVELRRSFELTEGEPVEIFVEGQNIILRKYAMSCAACGEHADLEDHAGLLLCPKCVAKLRRSLL